MARVFFLFILPALVLAQDGLYVSNSTNILRMEGGTGAAQSVHYDENARIVGITADIDQSKIFWTDISLGRRGIYAATLGNGQITDVTRIISDDIGECNGIGVDWVSRHVYWTDATRRSIEVANYDGSNRRVLTIDGLKTPRGIVVDPNGGYIYWGDQETKRIERARLDGSGREAIITSNMTDLTWPNEMVIQDNKLYFVDGSNKELRRSNLDGSSVETVKVVSGFTADNPVFGLATDSLNMYISVWHQGKILKWTLQGQLLTELVNALGEEPLFGLFYHRLENQPVSSAANSQPCKDGALAGCSHLCLPVTENTHRCSCPSYGGITLRTSTQCSEPDNVLFYTLADEGIVGYKDMSAVDNGDRYLIGRSLRPVAVAYDPVDKYVYWSDVHESTVHKAHFTGAEHTIFMSSSSHSIGVVDGLAMDDVHRKLYYTNMGEVRVFTNTHAWHKIELISLDGTGRKTLVENLGKPRGLHLDLNNNYMYYTDWGATPAVVRTDLDGSNAVVLRVGLDNPNAITTLGNHVYVVDSHHKTRASDNYPGAEMDGALYRMNNDGNSWAQLLDNLEVPFGLSVVNNDLYISDWGLGLLSVSNPGSNPSSYSREDQGWAGKKPMGLDFSTVSESLDTSQACHSSSCEICIPEPNDAAECTCDTYSPEVKDGSACAVPDNYLLVADYNSVKMINLDDSIFHGDERPEPQVVVEGNSYFSNYVALASDEDTVFYTDVNRGAIYKLVIGQDAEPTLFSETGYVVDGMDINNYDHHLYWTGITDPETGTGVIAKMHTNGDNATYEVILRDLNRPRAIKVNHNTEQMFWTEWADGEQRVARASTSTNGDDVVVILNSNAVSRPNGLDISFDRQKLLVGDAGQPSIKEYNYDGTNPQELQFSGERPEHIFSVKYAAGNTVLFTDWIRKTVSVLDRDTNQMIDIETNLMRPTEIVSKSPISVPQCPANNGCSHTCRQVVSTYYCSCPVGYVLGSDQKTCSQTDAWLEVSESECGSCNHANKVCAAPLGGPTYECHCDEGYEPQGDGCRACPENTFKPYPGNSTCVSCGDGSTTGGSTGSTTCSCSGGQAWDWSTNTCESSKPGDCPSTPISGFSCSGSSCSNDASCDGAMKCCGYSGCGSQCLNPESLDHGQCAWNGNVYQVDEVFRPSACVSCRCTLDKTFGNPLYGGAQCNNEECPPLSCPETVLPDGACCHVCSGDTCENAPIQITNCPTEIRTVTVPADSFVTTVQYEPQAVDNCNQGRAINMVGNVVQVAYGDTEVTVEVQASQVTGSGMDTDRCTFAVNVLDDHDPMISCPPTTTIQVSSSSTEAEVTITNPTVTDNVCGQRKSDGSDYASCDISLNDRDGRAMSVFGQYALGTYDLRYTATDAAGNQASCNFVYIIQQNANLHCDTPSVNNGQMSCQGNNEVTCSLTCNDGYSSTLLDDVTSSCTANGVWMPAFPEDLQQKGCARLENLSVLSRLTIIDLQCPTYSKEVIAAGLEEAIRGRYDLGEAEVQVLTSGCEDGNDDDFQIDIWLSAEYQTDDEYDTWVDTLTSFREDIEQDITNGNILTVEETPIDDGNVQEPEEPTSGCRLGEKHDTDSDKCVVCPRGTQGNADQTACVLCGRDTYQDLEGRGFCKRCPSLHNTNGATGSTHQAQCVPSGQRDSGEDPDKDDDDSFPIALVAGVVAGFLVLIVVIVIVVYVVLKKRGAGGAKEPAVKYEVKDGPAVEGHVNTGAYEGEGQYDELPESEKPSNYETLDETKRATPDDPYDHIRK